MSMMKTAAAIPKDSFRLGLETKLKDVRGGCVRIQMHNLTQKCLY